MVPNILLGTLMMIVTTGVHSVFTILSLRVLNRWLHRRQSRRLPGPTGGFSDLV